MIASHLGGYVLLLTFFHAILFIYFQKIDLIVLTQIFRSTFSGPAVYIGMVGICPNIILNKMTNRVLIWDKLSV